jgi:ankyrin repeat protein
LAFRGRPTKKANLVASVKKGDVQAVGELLEQGSDVNTTGMWGNTPLLAACQYNKSEIAVLCLAHSGVDVNVVNERGYTAILFASLQGLTDVVEGLLGRGATANLDEVRVYNSVFDMNMFLTPLSAAIVNGNASIVEHLLSQGCDANETYNVENHQDKFVFAETALLLALKRQADVSVVKALLRHGGDVLQEDSDGTSAAGLADAAAAAVSAGDGEVSEAIKAVQEWARMAAKFEGAGEVRGASAVS